MRSFPFPVASYTAETAIPPTFGLNYSDPY